MPRNVKQLLRKEIEDKESEEDTATEKNFYVHV